MGGWLYAAELAALERRKKFRAVVAGEAVALFLVGGDVFALQDTCVHKQRKLSSGVVWQGKVICPGHQWAFDPETGWNEENERCQPVYDVLVTEGSVYIGSVKRVRTAEPA